MSDDEADPELLELLRKSLGIAGGVQDEVSDRTGVLADAEYIYNNAIDVSIDMYGTKAAAASIYKVMQERQYSNEAWSQHELHPKASEGFSDVDIVNFVFTMDLLNFSFWSQLGEQDRFQVEYRGMCWTGYNSLVACLRRALDEGIPITTPRFWRSRHVTDDVLRDVFRGATGEEMPLLNERISILREASDALHESFRDPDERLQEGTYAAQGGDDRVEESAPISEDPIGEPAPADEAMGVDRRLASDTITSTTIIPQSSTQEGSQHAKDPDEASQAVARLAEPPPSANTSVQIPVSEAAQPTADARPDLSIVRLVEKAEHSAGRLVNLLAKHLPSLRDQFRFDGRRVRFLKRAQILVADLWAALGAKGYGEFHDIDQLTMFADYRLPQMLYSLGVLSYSPPLDYHIRDQKQLVSGHSWELQLRGCSIWAVELIRREIVRNHPGAEVNALLIDFFLYDLAKEREMQAGFSVPHHRTRSIWY